MASKDMTTVHISKVAHAEIFRSGMTVRNVFRALTNYWLSLSDTERAELVIKHYHAVDQEKAA